MKNIEVKNIDCLQHMKSMQSDSIDMIFTSPPYADRRKDTYGGLKASEYNKWFKDILIEMKRVIKPTGSIFINIKAHSEDGQRHLYVYKMVIMAVEEIGLKFVDDFAWIKNGFPGAYHGRFKNGWEPIFHFIKDDLNKITFNPLGCGKVMKHNTKQRLRYKNSGSSANKSGFKQPKFDNIIGKNMSRPSNVIEIPNVLNSCSKNKAHPAVFPVKLPMWFIKSFTNHNDVVYDPFTGSGTTGLACKKLNRRFIGSELNPEYMPIIEEMLKDDYVNPNEIEW